MTNVRSTFDAFKKYGDDGSWDFEKEMLAYAFNFEEEKNDLIKMFYEEKDPDYKFFLVEVLSELNEPCIIPYLLKIVNTEGDLNEKIWATTKLVQINYQEAQKIIIDLIDRFPIDKQTLAWEIFQLNSHFAQKFLKNLQEIDPEINSYVKKFKTYKQ